MFSHWCPVKRKAELLKAAAGVGLGSHNGGVDLNEMGLAVTLLHGSAGLSVLGWVA